MTTKIKQSLLGGITGTAAMSMVMFIAPFMGMPKMSAAAMLSSMMGMPLLMGWILHFMVGIIFALSYAFIFMALLNKVKSNLLKGIIFGLIAFSIAQIVMAMMGALMGGLPPMEGSKILMMLGSMMGHVIFGVLVGLFVKEPS